MTLADIWAQVWPNLAAQAIWSLPIFAWHHSRMNRLLSREREHIARELREHLRVEE